MTDFLEPTVATATPGGRLPADLSLWTVRQLVAALAELEDALRHRPTAPGAEVPPYLRAAVEREQGILCELHRRSVADTTAAAVAAGSAADASPAAPAPA